MALPFIPQSPHTVQFNSIKFVRRIDLNTTIRFSIAIEALYAQLNNVWGAATQIANKNNISRTFLYTLTSSLKEAGELLFGEPITSDALSLSREMAIETMLSLRLEGGSSLNAISTIMKRFKCGLNSVGSISQILSRFGKLFITYDSIHNE